MKELMEKPISPIVFEKLCSYDADLIVLKWLQMLNLNEKTYKQVILLFVLIHFLIPSTSPNSQPHSKNTFR